MRFIRALYPNYEVGLAAAHACASIIRGMDHEGWSAEYWMFQSAKGVESTRLKPLMPRPLLGVTLKSGVGEGMLGRMLEWRYLHRVRRDDVAYMWPSVSTGCYRALHERRVPIVREQINTHALTYRRLLHEAYAALGWPLNTDAVPTDIEIANEKEELALADFVFAPSELVAKSLVEGGVETSRIIPASYGWSDQDVLRNPAPAADVGAGRRPLTFMFAASGNVRKGLPWLLRAWKQANLSSAELHIYGSIEGIVAERCADLLALPNVRQFGYVRDLRNRYLEADVFVLPSHEEGSPMVSYCAAAAGLAMVVSPMGAGGFLRPGVDAMVLDPMDVNAWAQAFHLLHDDAQLRRGYQDNASLRAKEFTWQLVAQRRQQALISRVAYG